MRIGEPRVARLGRLGRRAFAVVVACAPLAFAVPGLGADGFEPAEATVVLGQGASTTIEKTLHLDAAPPSADIEIAIDTTGSMGPTIEQAKADATQIVNDVKAAITDARFAVVEFKDSGDATEYAVRQPLTADATAVQAAINGLTAGGGGDNPEAFNLVFRNSYTPALGGDIGWRAKTRKLVVVIGDAEPHGAGSAGFAGCTDTSVDPHGLNTATVLAGMRANERTLLMIRQPSPFASAQLGCYESLVAAAFPVGKAVDGGTSLGSDLVTLVEEAAKKISEVSFTVSPASRASWISFSPASFGGTGAALTAPLDLQFTETITVPPGTAPGTYTLDVAAVVDGAERTVQHLTVEVRQQATSSLTLTSDHTARPAGIAAVPIGKIPPERLSFLFGDVAAAPAGSIPAGSIPAGSIPAGSIPAGSIPAGSIPAGSIPAGSIPAGSIPTSILFGDVGLGATPAGSIPAGSIALERILLSSIPGPDWTAILAGTPLAGRPLNALTLADVAANADALGRLNSVRLRDIVLGGGLLGGVRYASLLLGNATLSQLPPPGGASTWCAAITAGGGDCTGLDPAQNTVLGVELAGRLGGTDIGSIPAGSIPAGSIPAGSIPAGSINLPATRLGDVLLSELTSLSAVVNCALIDCAAAGKTLADAYAVSAIRGTVADLLAALPMTHLAREITLGELIAAALLASSFPWESVPIQGLQDVAGTGEEARYRVDFDLDCSIATSFTITVSLPAGSFPVAGSSTVAYARGAALPVADPVAPSAGSPFRFRWSSFPAGACPSTTTRHVQLSFLAYQGLALGSQTAGATVTTNGVSQVTGQAPIEVTQNHEANDDPGTAPVVGRDTLLVQHIAYEGDVDFVRFPIDGLPPFTRVTAHLAVPDGADFDLAINQPSAPSFSSTPAGSIPAGSIPVEDPGQVLDNSKAALPPETLADVPAATPAGSIPAGSIPAGSISANRGSVDERTTVTLTGESGFLTIGVSGYNGSFSDDPGVLRIQVTPPPPLPQCDPRTFPNATPAANALPGALPADTKTIFLVNRQRLVALYGESDTDALLQAIGHRLTPGTLASRPEVQGAVLEVDGSDTVRSAYSEWDTSPCSVPAANRVVGAINELVAGYRAGLDDLTYVVLLGTDEALPFYRQRDLVTIAPELDAASDLAFTTNGLTNGNALYASAAQNTVLTDGAYGALTKIEWLGHDLPLAQLSVARLVETPAEMLGQVEQYIHPAVDGILDPATAATTGYDFLTEGATDISNAIAANFPGITRSDLLPPASTTWDRAAYLAAYFGASPIPAIGSLNAHYSHHLAQPASVAGGMVSTADVPAAPALSTRILFTMGCHGGLNVANTLGGSSQLLKDWAESYAQSGAAVYVGNTGFGYGETTPGLSGLSERLMALFAKRLGSNADSIGQQWAAALADYYVSAGNYDVYDEKVMIEATFYGLPFYRFATPGSSPVPTPPTVTSDGALDIATVTVTPDAVENPTGDGRAYWSSNGLTDDTLYRPVQPLAVTDVSVPGKRARGAFITALTTSDQGGVRPVQAYPAIDLAAHEPPPGFPNIFWPANVASVYSTTLFGEERATLAVTGQFRPDGPGSPTGVQRNVVSLTAEVSYSNSNDTVPPAITQVGAVMTDATTAVVFVRAHDDAGPLGKVAALVNDGTGWDYVPLQPQGGDLYTGTATDLAAAPEVLAQARDLAGLVGFSANKGFNFTAFADGGDPDIRIESPLPESVYLLNQQVEAAYACSDPGGVSGCSGSVADGALLDTSTVGSHTFTVTGTDLAGNDVEAHVPYEVHFQFLGFYEPVKNRPTLNSINAGRTVPLKWSLKDAAGAFQRDLAYVTAISSSRIKCPSATAEPLPDTVVVGASALRYDAGAEQYVFPWQTERSWAGTCRTLMLGLADGTVQTADFRFG